MTAVFHYAPTAKAQELSLPSFSVKNRITAKYGASVSQLTTVAQRSRKLPCFCAFFTVMIRRKLQKYFLMRDCYDEKTQSYCQYYLHRSHLPADFSLLGHIKCIYALYALYAVLNLLFLKGE